MKKSKLFFLANLILFPSLIFASDYVEGRVIFKLKNSIETQQGQNALHKTQNFLSDFGVFEITPIFPHHQIKRELKNGELAKIYEAKINVSFSAKDISEKVSNLKGIAFAEPRFINKISETPNDPQFSSQNHLPVINATQAWDIQHTDGAVLVGITDTGVDLDHPDLQANIWQNTDEIAGNNIDDDNNGYIDDVNGWDFAGNSPGANPDNDPTDNHGHGTHTSGDVAAVTNNGTGVAGISWNAKIMAVKAGPGNSDITHGYEAVAYAAENGAEIINCSWGNNNYTLLGEEVVAYAHSLGSAIVAASGNFNSQTPQTPAIFDGVLQVSATTDADQKASFSNYNNFVDISAPGQSILGTALNGNYTNSSGTSFSCPITSGVLALVKAQNPTWTNRQVLEQVRVSSDENFYTVIGNSAYTEKLGFGRLDAQRALTIQSPSVRVLGINYNDGGNGIPEPGETLQLEITIQNFLTPVQNLDVGISENSPHLTLANSTVSVGTLGNLQTTTISVDLTVAQSMPVNHEVLFSFTFEGTTANSFTYSDWEKRSELLLPAFITHTAGGIKFSVTDRGAMGFLQNSGNSAGEGFSQADNVNLMWAGTLLVGKSATEVSDANYAGSGNFDTDFSRIGNFIGFSTSGLLADQQSEVKYNDSLADTPLGIEITQTGFSYSNQNDSGYVILSFDVRNTNSTSLNGINIGLFFDWDIDETTYTTNYGGWDSGNEIGWMSESSSSTSKHCGLKVLNSQGASAYRVLPDEETWDGDGFSETDKWNALSGGFTQTSGTQDDLSHLIATGPYDIPANGKVRVAFAVIGAANLNDLVSFGQAAQTKWQQIDPLLGLEESVNENVIQEFKLSQNYPNPFNPSTIINYQLAMKNEGKLTIFNVLGEKVREFELTQQSGSVVWNGTNGNSKQVSSGIYFYRLKAGGFVETRKMLFLK
ncbi:MAG: T9SS C-terminal target domain-containing protein [Calditrichaeota bacterium]|nr:MAG: T9SS C-terminal target domain-containing protein [Calditrichota bacterium]